MIAKNILIALKNCFLVFSFSLLWIYAGAQNIAINTTGATADLSSLLDISGTGAGFLIPRMTTAQRPSSPANSLIIFNTTLSWFEYWDGAAWVPFLSSSNGWSTSGNTLTGTLPTSPNEWIGTINAADWIIKTNNTERMRILSGGFVGIGTITPTNTLHVYSNSGENGVTIMDGGAGVSRLNFYTLRGGGSRNWAIRLDQTVFGDFNLYQSATNGGDPMAGNCRLYIKNDGLVGIGTTTPAGGVHIASAGNQWSSFNYGTNLIIKDASTARNTAIGIFDAANANPWALANSSGDMSFAEMPALGNIVTAPSIRVTFEAGGNVGIGTTNPAYKLDVAGIINTSLGGQYSNGCVRFGSHTLNSNSNGWLYVGDESTNVYGGRGIAMGNCYVASAFYYPNGSHGAGKVLVSDAAGLASWSTVAPASNLDSRVGSSSATTSSATYAIITSGINSISFTTTGHSVLLFFTGDVSNNTAGATVRFKFTIDGTDISYGWTGIKLDVAGSAKNISMNGLVLTPSAGAHTYAVQWATDMGTATLSNLGVSSSFIVVEQ